MKADAGRPHADPLVTAAEIARLAGVTRAAVSNWRRRYADFPAPATDSTSSPLFDLAEVRAWLDAQRKGQEMSPEVRLWQQLRTDHGDDMIGGLTAVARLLARREEIGDAALRPLVDELAADRSPAELLAGLTARFAESSGRAGSDGITSPHLVRAVRHFAGPDVPGRTVYDPACGIGSLLFAFRPGARALAGQELDPARARYAELRAEVTGPAGVTVRAGDSLRADGLPELRADLVVCEPPAGAADWGREELLLDPRWEFGVPSRAESELAWLQHCYRHTAPGGRVVVVMPASVAYRKAGRRIRAEIVRRGLLTEVVALPPGMAATHALSVHLWLLRRPTGPEDTADHVRMTDLSANAPDGPFEAADDQTVPVARIDLLDDTVDLSPAAYISARHTDFTAQYAATRAEIKERLERLLDTLLPPLLEGTAESFQERATVGLAELARAGLVETTEGATVSTSDQLDTDYINGFLHGAANNRRSTSASGTFRLDTRGARIPQMAVEEQRRYGSAFRALTEFEQAVAQLARLSERTTTLARTGLTTGTLRPPAP